MSSLNTPQVQSDYAQSDPTALNYVNNKPTLGQQVTVDSGWTANSTAGDKTAILSSYSNGLSGTMVTALNLVSANTGTALSAAMNIVVLLVKKVAALETALAANKLPNT